MYIQCMYMSLIKYTLFLKREQLEQLKKISDVDNPVSKHIRKAINNYLKKKVIGYSSATSPSVKGGDVSE